MLAIFISLFFATLILFLIITMFTGGPYVPSRQVVVEQIAALMPLKAGQTVYDLGSGDGRVLLALGKRGIRGVGIELNPYVALWSWILIVLSGQLGRIWVKWGSYWQVNLALADGIVVYALPGFMEKLSQKLRRELKPGTPVVSNAFQIPGLKLIRKETVGIDRIFVYKI